MCGVIMFFSSNFHVAHGFSHVGFSAGTVVFVNNRVGYPTCFVSSTIDNFIHKQNEANEKLIPDFLFDERKKISIQLPFCERNKKLSKKFIAKLNSFTDNKYSVVV